MYRLISTTGSGDLVTAHRVMESWLSSSHAAVRKYADKKCLIQRGCHERSDEFRTAETVFLLDALV